MLGQFFLSKLLWVLVLVLGLGLLDLDLNQDLLGFGLGLGLLSLGLVLGLLGLGLVLGLGLSLGLGPGSSLVLPDLFSLPSCPLGLVSFFYSSSVTLSASRRGGGEDWIGLVRISLPLLVRGLVLPLLFPSCSILLLASVGDLFSSQWT